MRFSEQIAHTWHPRGRTLDISLEGLWQSL